MPVDGFSKVYDGDNHEIRNLWIDRFDRDNVGLFGALAIFGAEGALTPDGLSAGFGAAGALTAVGFAGVGF